MVWVVVMVVTPLAAIASGDISSIQQVASSKVGGCQYVGDIRGFSGWGKAARSAWKDKAKHQALGKADELGATHVVWTRLPKSYGSDPYAYGEAYYCDSAESLARQTSSSPSKND